MTVVQLKNNLHQLVDKVIDNSILEAVYTILANQVENEKQGWESLNPLEKQAIEEAITQLERGEGIPHEIVMQKYFEKYQKK